MNRKNFLNRRHFVGACASVMAFPTLAQSFPLRPIRIIVPYPAGGTTDQLARAIQLPLQEFLGQPIVIDNKPGAGGTIGTDLVAKSVPDGYTLVFGNTGPNALVPLMRKVPYDPIADFQPVSTVAFTPMILAVPSNSPAATLKEFLAYARQQGNAMNYGSVGVGSFSHLTGEYFNELSGLKMVHVPYAGGAPLLTAFASGQLHAAFVTGLDGASMLASGKVRYLAVATPSRTDVVPGLAPIAEEVPGFNSTGWFGVFAPKGVPAEVQARLNAAVTAAVRRPDIRKLFSERLIEARGSTAQQMEALIASDQKLWGQVIRKFGITS